MTQLDRPGSAGNPKTLDRVLSRSGLCSRSQAALWIASGRVRVDGRIVVDPMKWVLPDRQQISVDGKPISSPKPVYLALYKPRNVLTTREDPAGRPTVYDLLPSLDSWIFPVGRLDLETTGLLLFTNDARWSEGLMDPLGKVPKLYQVRVAPRLTDEQLRQLQDGVELSDGLTGSAVVHRLRDSGNHTVFEITICEGRNRQIRRMVEAIGGKVSKLARIAIGPLRLGSLQVGQWRMLSQREVEDLAQAGGVSATRGAVDPLKARASRVGSRPESPSFIAREGKTRGRKKSPRRPRNP